MNLLNTYEEYNQFHKGYIQFIEELLNSNIESINDVIISFRLEEALKKFEELHTRVESIIVEEDDRNNLMDLKYLVFDGLLLSSELLYFYKNREIERLKMRISNYLDKIRRAEIFKDSKKNSCRVYGDN